MPTSISIVIPAYNEADNIAKCLDSIASQSVMPNCVIVVNNNSTDETASIAKRYKFVDVINEQRQGISFAHKRGFDEAKTELIARIDAESVLPSDWVESVVGYFEDNKDVQAVGGSGYFYNTRYKPVSRSIVRGTFISMRVLMGFHSLWGPNFILRRHAWQKVRDEIHTSPDIFDDFDLALHLNEHGFKTVWLQDLEVGAQIRNNETLVGTLKYVMRYPRTLKVHNDARWVPAAIGAVAAAPALFATYKLIKNKKALAPSIDKK